LLCGASARTQGGLQAQLLGNSCHPPLVPIRATAARGQAQPIERGLFGRAVNVGEPAARATHRPSLEARRVLLPVPLEKPRAAPAPVFRPLHQACRQCVRLDISRHGYEMIVILHDERFVSALVDVTCPGAFAERVKPLSVCDGYKTHVLRQITVLAWPEEQMPMVRHQAPGKDAHLHARLGFGKYFLERKVVAVVMEEGASTVRTVKRVEYKPARSSPWRPWHGP
jgi:hypothetical protein